MHQHQYQGNYACGGYNQPMEVAGLPGVVAPTGDDDGNDFELKSTSEHFFIHGAAQRHQQHRSQQQQHRRYLPTNPSPYPAPSTPPLHTQGSNSVLQYLATGIPPKQSVKRPIVNPVPAVGASSGSSLLTGRPIISANASTLMAPSSTATATTVIPSSTPGSRRNIVHKYHSFRKISPKNQNAALSAAGASLPPRPLPPSSANRTPQASTVTGSSSMLLKSLLEAGGTAGGVKPSQRTVPPIPKASPMAPPPQTVAAVQGSFNQPAHLSRGTWQLGGKAVVLDASITAPKQQQQQHPKDNDVSHAEVISSAAVPQAALHVSTPQCFGLKSIFVV